MIAYNLQNWFQSVILPKEYKTKEMKTLRRLFYKVSGIITGSDRYRHIKFARNLNLEVLLTCVRRALNEFVLVLCK